MSDYLQIKSEDWSDFRTSLLRYAELPRDQRNEFWFRGQGSSDWTLSTTLDRGHKFQDVQERNEANEQLLSEFKTEAIHVGTPENRLSSQIRLDFLARHHGLPSPLMDWSLSPYVATYFAYAAMPKEAEYVSVWCLDLKEVDWNNREDIDLLRDDLPFFENRRALQQRSVFLKVFVPENIETLIPQALTRFDLPASDKKSALQDLDEMLVNATTMFYDLEGAAKTSVLRFFGN
ncbi:MAG: FRG domain-containing protein [Planctomycetota bacterium]